MKKNEKITFSQKDTIEGFEIFLNQFYFRNDLYNFHQLLGQYLFWLDNDIKNGYEQDDITFVKSIIKKHIFSYYRNVDFNIEYKKDDIFRIALT